MKHWSLFGNYLDPLYTAIYRLSRFDGELPPEEQLLLEVQRAINGDEEKGRKLWNMVNGFKNSKYLSDTDGMTDERLLRMIAEIEKT